MTDIAAFPTRVTYEIEVEWKQMQGTIQLSSMPNFEKVCTENMRQTFVFDYRSEM